MKSPAVADEVVTAPVVVADDADPEHVLDGQVWSELQIEKPVDVAEVSPGLVATRVYPPGWFIIRPENEAIPPLARTMTVADRVPGLEFGPMATLTSALEEVTSWPDPFTTSTLTGPPWEATWEVIAAPTAVSVGSAVNFSEHDPVGLPESFAALAESDDEQVDVARAAGAAIIAAPRILAASIKKETRATMEPAFGMATPFTLSTNRHERPQDPALPEDPAMHSHVSTLTCGPSCCAFVLL